MNKSNLSFKEIVDKVDIVEIISNYVQLEKRGKNYFGLCPFHDDNNPSMSVSPERKMYKCFSCAAGGNVINFVANIENISSQAALQKVASTVGIEIEIYVDPREQENKKYYEIMQKAADFYKFSLFNLKEGQTALKYLYDRKLNDNIIKRFQIGLSLRESNMLYQALTEKDILPLDLMELGLIRRGQDYYDLFRSRIMFPIEDLKGNIVGFSGRTYLSNQNQHKYVNSPENIIFQKSDILYNYHQAANDIRRLDHVFIFEGFMDVIAAFRANIVNTVATMGTAVTNSQVNAIKKLTKNVIICFDGDSAGITATKRAIEVMASSDLNINVVTLPDELDPDDYINKYGEEELKNYLEQNQESALEFLYNIAKRKLVPNNPNSIEEFKRTIFTILHRYSSGVLNEIFLKKMSEDLGVSIDSLYNDLNLTQPIAPREPTIVRVPVETQSYNKRKYEQSEKYLIVMAYQTKDDCRKIVDLLESHYVIPDQRELLFKLYDYYQTNETMDPELLKDSLSPQQLELITEILQHGHEEVINLSIEDLVTTVKDYKTKEQIYQETITELRHKDEMTSEDLDRLIKAKMNIIKMK